MTTPTPAQDFPPGIHEIAKRNTKIINNRRDSTLGTTETVAEIKAQVPPMFYVVMTPATAGHADDSVSITATARSFTAHADLEDAVRAMRRTGVARVLLMAHMLDPAYPHVFYLDRESELLKELEENGEART